MEANNEEHGAGQEKPASHMKENSFRFEWKFLFFKKNSRGLSTDMKKVPTVPYVKEQGCNRSKYIGFLNPITCWKMTKLYHLASITTTLLNVNKTLTSRNGEEKGKEL